MKAATRTGSEIPPAPLVAIPDEDAPSEQGFHQEQGQPLSADVFISYSRKDIAFARLIRASLQSSGLDTWIDWDRIPVGARWWEEITQAIESSNVFMFIISGSSVGSSVCRDEIDQALKNHKRIIPILVDELAPETVHRFVPELPEINWVIFEKDDLFRITEDHEVQSGPPEDRQVALPKLPQFEQAMARLSAAIHTDWEWVKSHTQLQVDASRWSGKDRDASLLLRGSALEEAEAWLSHAGGRDPQPTLLQSQFITASRLEETRRQRENSRRQRRLLWVIGGALVITVALGAVALIQRDEAQRQATAAQSGELAAESRVYQDARFDVSSLLAVESWNTLDSSTSRNALLSALQSRARLKTVLWTSSELSDVVFSPDGSLLAGAYCAETDPISYDCTDNEVGLWATADGSASSTPLAGQQGPLAFTPDGTRLVTRNAQWEFVVWDLGLRQTRGPVFSGVSTWPGGLAFDASGTMLAVAACASVDDACSGTQVLVWDFATGRLLYRTADASAATAYVVYDTSLTFSPDGRTLAWGGCAEAGKDEFGNPICLQGSVLTWDTVGGQTVEHPVTGPAVGSVAFSPDGRTIAVLTGTSPMLLDAGSWQETATGNGPLTMGVGPSLTFGHDGLTLAVASLGHPISLLDGHDARQIDLLDIGSEVLAGDSVSIHPREDTLASAGCYQRDRTGYLCEQGIVLMWDIGIRPPLGRAYAPTQTSEGWAFLSPDGTRRARSSCVRTVQLDELSDRCVEHRVDISEVAGGKPLGPPLLGLPGDVWAAFTDTGDRLVTTSCTTWDPELIQICVATQIDVWDVGSGTRVRPSLVSNLRYAYRLALAPDGRTLILIGAEVERWDLVTGQRAADPLPGWQDTSQVEAVAFSTDGTHLAAAGCMEGVNPQNRSCQRVEARVWDTVAWTTTGEPIALTADLSRTAGTILEDLRFSPDGSQLAIATAEEIRFWDMGDGTFANVSIPTDRPWSITYAPDGSLLAVQEFHRDGTVWIVLWDLTQMQQLGRAFVEDSSGGVEQLVFSRDGAILVSTSGLQWDLDPVAWRARVCQMVQRDFTVAEWARFMGSAPYRETCSFPVALTDPPR